MDVNYIKDCLEETKSAYRSSRNNLLWLEQYRLEHQNYREYKGREILELLQNADDAQSSDVDICLDTVRHILTITNRGEHTKAFTDKGMRSIMMSYLSPKKNDTENSGKLIGAKGLGFKSILNWTSEITIKSDNVRVRFGEDVVANFWQELRANIENPEEYESEAREDGHNVPLPILRIPEVEELHDFAPKTTTIELNYVSKEVGDKILKALTGFTPESLLFLHNLRNIRIAVDGDEQQYSLRVISESEGIETCMINDSTWLVARENGTIDDKRYEVAAAFSLDGNRQNSYNLYTFFPTQEEFPFPCILHATLELNASRNVILTGIKVNSVMMQLLAGRIIALANRLKRDTHGWDAYRLVAGSFADKNYSVYALELKEALVVETRNSEFIPILSGGYSNASRCYYFNDTFFDFVEAGGGTACFERMMLKGAPASVSVSTDSHAVEHIQEFADSLNDYTLLAAFIKIVHDYYSSKKTAAARINLHLLRDDDNNKITGTAYLNTGRKIADIPDFLGIKYVATDLQKALLREFGLHGTEQEQVRAIAGKLNDTVTEASASDVSGIKRMLMISRKEVNKFSTSQINDIIECLFKLYLSNTDEFKKIKVECYLPTEAGQWRPASELIFGDERFPDGFRNLKLCASIHDLNDYVAFPEFLKSSAGGRVQDFYTALGVNCYFLTREVCYGDDSEYLKSNGLSKNAIANAPSWRVGAGVNVVTIPAGLDKWHKLSLTDLVKLILKSGLSSQVMNNLGLTWYYGRGWFGPEPLKTNYISYLLKRKTAAAALSNYVITTREWLLDADRNFKYDDRDDMIPPVLKRLGAKYSYSDFTSRELHDLINAKAAEFERTGNEKGIKEFYHKVKVAFVTLGNKAALPDNVALRMLCTLKGKTVLMDSREIFYSNNWTSKKLQEELPILLLQLRDGEDEVNRYFGCRRVKDLKVKTVEIVNNNSLTQQLNSRLQKCKPYLLALTSKDTGDGVTFDRDKKSQIDRLSVDIVKSASYSFEHHNIKTVPEAMTEGEMISNDRTPLICSGYSTLADALLDPQFCNVVAEAVCVVLNLSARDNIDRFYRIIKASDRELKFLSESINPDLWQSCQEAFGISDAELAFWEIVFSRNGKAGDFDRELIRENKNTFIADRLGISIDRANQSNFMLYHIQQLQRERSKYVPAYKSWLYNAYLADTDKQKHYLSRISQFQSDDWIYAFLETEDKYLVNPDYNLFIVELIKERFGFDTQSIVNEDCVIPSKLEYYNYDGLDLNIEDESLLYFPGHEDYFLKLKQKHTSAAPNNDDNSPASSNSATKTSDPLGIMIVDTQQRPGFSNSGGGGNRRGKGTTRRRLNDADLQKIGDQAEDKVLQALQAPDSGYEVGAIYSKHLNPDSGNDAQGYDLEYRKVGDSIYRCLEIKHFSGSSIIVSRHEYEVSQSDTFRNRYDVALVDDSGIKIWRNAFADESKYTKSSDDYTITFKVTPATND